MSCVRRTALVTGASGFLGMSLCRALDARGASVICVPAGNRDVPARVRCEATYQELTGAFRRYQVDVLFHLLAGSGVLYNETAFLRASITGRTSGLRKLW